MTDSIEIGAAVPRWHNRALYWLGHGVLRLFGWRLNVRVPDLPKFIIIAAPHTSNWDFVFGMAAVLTIQVKLHWYAKHTLFGGLHGRLFRWLGGIPVNRSAAGGVVAQTSRAFAGNEQLIIALAPEGTRSLQPIWKRGFYHMAIAADVPVLVAYIDYAKREIGIGPTFTPTGDWAADMKPVFDFYRRVQPKRPDKFAIEDL